jgi:peptidase E
MQQALAGGYKKLISQGMTQAIIDYFEPIQVKEQNGCQVIGFSSGAIICLPSDP